jgi:carbon storage regulator
MMLVLSRRRQEEIVIGGAIRIRITAIDRRHVKLAISAPVGIPVVRGELLSADTAARQSGSRPLLCRGRVASVPTQEAK